MGPSATNTRVLVLGGAGETHAVLQALGNKAVGVIWTGVRPEGPAPDIPELYPKDLGALGFADILRTVSATHLLDVSHGFEAAISADAAAACAGPGVPYANLRRPAWRAAPGDDWRDVADIDAARAAIAPYPRVFTNVGRALLPGLRGHPGHLLVRQNTRHAHSPMLKNASFVFGSPPFTQAEEEALFAELRIDAVLFRNTGGDASVSKVHAARAMGLPMIMLARPPAPEGLHLSSLQDVTAWADAL